MNLALLLIALVSNSQAATSTPRLAYESGLSTQTQVIYTTRLAIRKEDIDKMFKPQLGPLDKLRKPEDNYPKMPERNYPSRRIVSSVYPDKEPTA